MLSVSQLVEKVGRLRRERRALHEQSVALFNTAEETRAKIDAFEGDLTEEQAAEVEGLRAAAARMDGDLKANEAKVEALTREIEDGQNRINQASVINARSAAMEQSAGVVVGSGGMTRIEALPATREQQEHDLADLVRAACLCRGLFMMAPQIARDTLHNDRLACAMESSSFADGGFLVPVVYVPDLIELLRAESVIRRMAGLRTPPLVNGNLTLPKQTGGASAYYIGEGENIPPSQATGGQRKWTAKKLVALVPVSNDLLRRSSPSADQMIRQDLVSCMALAEDLAFIRGTGTGNGPKGLRYWALSAAVHTMTATPTFITATTDSSKMLLSLANNNVQLRSPYWLFAPRTKQWLADQRVGSSADGNFAFPEIAQGNWRGVPYLVSNQIPINLSTNQSEVYLVEATDIVLADEEQFRIEASSEAAYHDGSNVVAAFSLDQTVIRVISQHDFGPRHDEAISILQGVTWGA